MTHKICSKCRTVKPSNEFYKRKHRKSELQSWCKECVKQASREREVKKYKENAAFREQKRAYYYANRSAIRHRQNAYLLARYQNDQSYKTTTFLKSQTRTYLKRGASTAEKVPLIDIAHRDNWTCHLCGRKVTKATWSLDHIIPLSKGGLHIASNVALAHRSCNSRRGAGRMPAQMRMF